MLIIVLLTILILINLRDEKLTPAAQVLLREPTYLVPVAENGFFILRAINADASLDAFSVGKKQVQEEAARYRAEPPHLTQNYTLDNYKTSPASVWDVRRCQETLQSCVEEDLRNREKVTARIKANDLLLQRYAQMRALPGFEERVIPAFTAVVPYYPALTHAAELLMEQAALDIADGNIEKGITRLQENDRYMRLFLKNSSTLISKMISLSMMRKQARVVSELVNKYPQLAREHGDIFSTLVRSVQPTEINFKSAFVNEARYVNFYLGMASKYSNSAIGASGENSSSDSPLMDACSYFCQLFLHPNATINELSTYWQQQITTANQPASTYTKIRANLAANHTTELPVLKQLHYVYNPIGKILIDLTQYTPDPYINYMEKGADTDGYLRLVGLQIKLRQQNIAETAIADFVAKAPEPFRSPYDSSAMIWNAKDRQLEFIGRQDTSSNLNHGKRFIVPLG